MYNPFVGACVTAMRHSGISTLRFNFSTPDGAGDDVEELLSANTNELLAALTMFANAAPQAGIVLVGYSWGAVVALSAARKDAVTSQSDGRSPRVAGLALIAPPISVVPPGMHPGRGDFARWPMLLCAGDDDEYCEESKLRAIAGGSATSLVVMNGVSHFLHGGVADKAALHAVEWVNGLDGVTPRSR